VYSGQENLVAIEGSPLIGKSSTARELMHRLRTEPAEGTFNPTEHRFFWFDAHDRCPSLAELCGHLALETDRQSLSTAAITDKRDELLLHLGQNKTVLFLDDLNLSDKTNSRELIDLLERIPGNSVVIAAVNRPGELRAPRIELQDFEPADVKFLLEEQAHRFDLEGIEHLNNEFVERLVDLIGGNPGVIEWFLRGYDETSEPLEDRVAALKKSDELSELFGPAWRTLDDECQQVLEACAHLGGEATAEQIAMACNRPQDEVVAVADSLRREKLLTAVRAKDRQTLFTCARAFQLFIVSNTPEPKRRQFTNRLTDHFVDYFTVAPEDAKYGADQVEAWAVLRRELYEAEDDERMQALFRAVLDILFTLGQYDQLIDAASWAFKSADRASNYSGAALAGAMKAGTHIIRGEMTPAEDALALATNAASIANHPGPISRVRRCRGFFQYRSRKPRQALDSIKDVEQMSQEGAEPINLVDTLDLRTAVNWYLRKYDDCEAAAHASLKAGAKMNWERARAYPLRYLAELAYRRRRPAEAHVLLDEAEEISTRLGDKRQRARVDLSRARICLFEGDLETAAAAAAAALSEIIRLGLPAEREEVTAVVAAIERAQKSWGWRRYYALRRPARLTSAPVGGD
jgi:hypothetical protein